MKTLIETLTRRSAGHGHYKITIEYNGEEITTTTTNMPAIDAAFDEDYDDADNSGRLYESSEEAQEALVNEILRANHYN